MKPYIRMDSALIAAALMVLFLAAAALAEDREIITFVAAAGPDGIQRVEIMGGAYYFNPNHIVLRSGVPTVFRVWKKQGITPHNIVIKNPEAGMDFAVDFGGDRGAEISFTPLRPGLYQFYCDKRLLFFQSHREKGMHGTIEVVE